MKAPSKPPRRDLLLIGGGHSHVQALKSFGMAPLEGVRITVIAREVHTPYSGMLPGYVAGFHDWDDIHIDLGPLCRFAGARLIDDEVAALDLDAGLVHCLQRRPFALTCFRSTAGRHPRPRWSWAFASSPSAAFCPNGTACATASAPTPSWCWSAAGRAALNGLGRSPALPDSTDIRVVAADILPGHGRVARRCSSASWPRRTSPWFAAWWHQDRPKRSALRMDRRWPSTTCSG